MHELEKLRRLIAAFKRFSQINSSMQVGTALTLLEVALADMQKKTIAPSDLEKRLGMPSGTMSRNVYYWADGHKEMSGAFEMITIKLSAEDRRRRELSLSNKGRAFIAGLLETAE